MRYYKMQMGTNPHVFDVLTIADDGTMTMDCRVCERLVHYDGLTMEHTPYGDRINYGKGSSMPWTDKKGNISAHWSEVPCNDAITDVKGTPEDVKSIHAKSETEVKANVEAEAPTVTDAAAAAGPVEQEQERQRCDQELQTLTEREMHRQLHRSRHRRVSNGQHPDIDRPTDESEQPATARRNRRAVANSSFFTLHSSFLKPLAVAAASVVACIVIYETGLLIPMGLIGLATSGIVK